MGKLKLLRFGFGALQLFCPSKISNKVKGQGFQNDLKNISVNQGLVYLTSPQVGEIYHIMVKLKKQFIKNNKWNGYKSCKNSDFDTYINLQITNYSKLQKQIWQQHSGYPGLKLLINRSQKCLIKYQTSKKYLQKQQQIQGFQSIIFQQGFDSIEACDPLRKALDIQIINPQLKNKHEQLIKKLFKQYKKQQKQKQKQKQQQHQFKTLSYNKLYRQIIYSITQKYLT